MDNEFKDRIRKVRKYYKLTQEEFGNRLGIKRNTVATYETTEKQPMSSIVTSICREFSVNEIWLKTGEGGDENMFTKISQDDRFSLNLGKLSMTENEFVKNGVNLLAETDPDKLKTLEEFMKGLLGIE